MNDDIQLPPLPPFSMAPVADTVTVRDYARAAVLADRERRAEQVPPAKPTVHSRQFSLMPAGAVFVPSSNDGAAVVVNLRWTDDGRAWIDNKRNRELAQRLRFYPSPNYDEQAMVAAADALDGGER